jgi:hypothetical protein
MFLRNVLSLLSGENSKPNARKGGMDKGEKHEGVRALSDPIRIRRPVKEFKALRKALLSEERPKK